MPIMLNEQDTVACGNTQDCQHSALSEEHTSELQSPCNLVCRLLLEKKKKLVQRSAGFQSYNETQRSILKHTPRYPHLTLPSPPRHRGSIDPPRVLLALAAMQKHAQR